MARDYIAENDLIDADDTPDVLMNDAYVLGTATPEMETLLDTPVTLMGGRMYGQKDRRNTQDGDWKPVTLSWLDWMNGQEGKFGLTRHPVAKAKEGESLVFAEAIGGARKDSAIKTMASIGLDIDSGAALDDVVDLLVEKEIFAIVYTSFSNGKTVIELKHDDVVRKLKLDDSPNRTQVQEYLREHHKDRYDPEFINGIEILDPRKQTQDGLRIVVKTLPLDKFRVILPLAEPVDLADLAPTVSQWKDKWADAVTGVAVNMLGVNFDATSCDVNRLFFTPRHPKDAEDWYACVVQGKPLRFQDIEPYSKNSYVKKRDDSDPFAAGLADDGPERDVFMTPGGKHLNKWHTAKKERFLITDVLETFCQDKIRLAGGEKVGTAHVECPFEHEHSSTGGTATMVINPLDSDAGYWTMFCRHDACNGRDKLEFLQEMLAQNWFDESVLEDEDFLLPAEDEDEDEVIEDVDLDVAIEKSGLNKESSEKDVRNFLKGFLTSDAGVKNRISEKLGSNSRPKGNTAFTNAALNKLWKKLSEESAQREIEEDADTREASEDPDYTPLEDATANTVRRAAKASKWLPSGFSVQDGWFGELLDEGSGGTKFRAAIRAFEVLYSADGVSGSSRTNQITIRYMHRSKGLGVVESVFRIGDIYKDSGTILSKLRNEGLDFHAKASTETILTILRAIRSQREAVYYEQSGWNEDRSVYMSPTGQAVTREDDKCIHVLEQTMSVCKATRGAVEEFSEAASAALRGRNASRFLPGFMIGPVGCLTNFLGVELNPILENSGKARHGKTTSLKAGVAWFAIPTEEGLLVSADSTSTALAVMSVKASGAAFAPDEDGGSNKSPEELQEEAAQFANGIGRGRGNAAGGMRDIESWSCCQGRSTENGSLNRLEAAKLKDGTVDIKSGIMSRIFTVNYDKAVKLNPTDDAAELDAYNVLAHDAKKGGGVYGVAGPVFAAQLLKEGVEAVQVRVSALVTEWRGKHIGAAERVVETAALFGAAVEVAVEAGLLPKDIDLKAMLKGLLEETLEQRAHHLDTERQAKDSLRLNIIRAVNNGTIRPVYSNPEGYRETLGYFKEGDTAPDASTQKELCARTYILPKDRLSQLGVKTEHNALIADLRKKDAIVEPNGVDSGVWRDTPGEGRVPCIRLTGEFVHG